jgi:hypothetical protein
MAKPIHLGKPRNSACDAVTRLRRELAALADRGARIRHQAIAAGLDPGSGPSRTV